MEARNGADSLIHQTKKMLEDSGEKVEASEKENIEKIITEFEEILKDDDITKEAIEAKTKELTEASHKVAEAMYAKKDGDEPEEAKKDNKKDEDVIDAEVE